MRFQKTLIALSYALVLIHGCTTEKNVPFPEFSDAIAVTEGPHDHFLASYFAINSWSKDYRYLLILETDIKGRLPEADEPATLALVDLEEGNKIIPIAQTHCWNFQEAAMAHWLPWADDTIIYNDSRDDRFVSVILNWKTGEERIIPFPVSAVSPDGLWAVSINYARLRLTRPDYGYAGQGQDPQADISWPDNDGLWLVNLTNGEAKLIVDIAGQKDKMTQMTDPEGLAYFCHTVFSKDGKKIFWLARTVENLKAQGSHVGKWETTSLTCNVDGTDVRRCFPDGWGGSHFNWKDGKTMVVTARADAGKVHGHVIFTVGEEEKVQRLAPGIMDFDGHCIFTPDGNFISSDGYWNRDEYRPWVLYRVSDGHIVSLGHFFVPQPYREQYSRCDLHPRYRDDFGQVAFNSVHEGSRQVYIRNISKQ